MERSNLNKQRTVPAALNKNKKQTSQPNQITNYFGKSQQTPLINNKNNVQSKKPQNSQQSNQQNIKTRAQVQKQQFQDDDDEEMKMDAEPINENQYSQSVLSEVKFQELLRDMGYHFVGQDQELRHLQTGEKFKFTNQQEYDYLCQLVIGYIQQQMVQQYDMIEIMIPEDETGPKCNIFVSNNYYDESIDKCLVIIQGTGEVRVGMWSRRVCINDNLYLGSMFPQIEWALQQGFKIIVFNPNMRVDNRFQQKIKYCQTMSSHCNYVWGKYLSPLKCKHLAVLAHSAGGRCVADLYANYKKDFLERVKALVFTDSFYHGMLTNMKPFEEKWAKNAGIHFKKYFKTRMPLGEVFKKQNGIIQELSAGTDQHELTTGYSHELIIQFIGQKFSKL